MKCVKCMCNVGDTEKLSESAPAVIKLLCYLLSHKVFSSLVSKIYGRSVLLTFTVFFHEQTELINFAVFKTSTFLIK